jgi:hypothetical protein
VSGVLKEKALRLVFNPFIFFENFFADAVEEVKIPEDAIPIIGIMDDKNFLR